MISLLTGTHSSCCLCQWPSLTPFIFRFTMVHTMIPWPSTVIHPVQSMKCDWIQTNLSYNILPNVRVSPETSLAAIRPSKLNWNCISDCRSSSIRNLLQTMDAVLGHCAVLKVTTINEPQYWKKFGRGIENFGYNCRTLNIWNSIALTFCSCATWNRPSIFDITDRSNSSWKFRF